MGLRLLLVVLLFTAAACTSRPPQHDRSGETHYNRRELQESPGLFTGKTGEWKVRPRRAEPGASDSSDEDCPGRDSDQCDSEQRH
ncbi:MAG: hypothetical protein AMXMBFR8_22840 [Nevskiales bacterium]